MVALVDIDDTLTPAQKHILEYVNQQSKCEFLFEEMTWEFREQEIEGYDEYVQEFLNTPELVMEYLPYAFALPALEKLAKSGHEVHIASSRKEGLHEVTETWLEQHGFAPHVDKIHPRFSEVEKGADFKRTVAEKYGVTVAFDDTHSVIEALAQVENIRIYVIDKPWNQREVKNEHDNEIIRVPSFAAGVEHLLFS